MTLPLATTMKYNVATPNTITVPSTLTHDTETVVNILETAMLSILHFQTITNKTKHSLTTHTHPPPVYNPVFTSLTTRLRSHIDTTADIAPNDTCAYPESHTPKLGLGPDRGASDDETDHFHHSGRSGSLSE
jgi:hypothetical protein